MGFSILSKLVQLFQLVFQLLTSLHQAPKRLRVGNPLFGKRGL